MLDSECETNTNRRIGNVKVIADIDLLCSRLQRKNEYLRFIAHDLRNPLTAIFGNAELILEDIFHNRYNSELFAHHVNNIIHASKHISSLLTELDKYTIFEGGDVELNLMSYNIDELLKESFDMYLPVATNKSITFKSNYGVLPAISIDPVRILEVMDNLITNALKYTKPPGEVYVSADYDDLWVYVSVTDSGEGLSDEDLKDIFKPFARLSSKPVNGEKSTGLGLYISKRIVDLHGGSIHVESTKGLGSRFGFQLPRKQ
ncbi:HAMP domain-containing histidine kinase [bacterium]|nr:HAMP domain-containing histidine kinase [bacterium]